MIFLSNSQDYRLDFSEPDATRWNGAPSTIVPEKGREVWGAIWEISNENLSSLDHQEGVHVKKYRPMEVAIVTPSGDQVTCRVYILCDNPGPLKPNKEFTNLPSETYILVIICGAIESGLPIQYIQWLKSIQHNGRKGIPELVEILKDHL